MCRIVEFPFSVDLHSTSLLVVPSELSTIHPNICKRPRYVGAILCFVTYLASCQTSVTDSFCGQSRFTSPTWQVFTVYSVQPLQGVQGRKLDFSHSWEGLWEAWEALISFCCFDELSHWHDPFGAQRTLLVDQGFQGKTAELSGSNLWPECVFSGFRGQSKEGVVFVTTFSASENSIKLSCSRGILPCACALVGSILSGPAVEPCALTRRIL